MRRDPYRYYRIEARELLDALGKGAHDLEKGDTGPEPVARLLRVAHTLKGASRVVKQPKIAALAHDLEEQLASYRENGAVPPAGVEEILRLNAAMGVLLSALDDPSGAINRGDEPAQAIAIDLEEADAVLRIVSAQSGH